MATTNHTPTIELSQYTSTDKTSYLVNYNDDMLKIDSAIAVDRDNITSAQNTADTAEGKADANKTSIDTLNGQINDPSGLAEQVSGNSSAINTINSLIGNGEPTTTDKTIIGAINELAGDISDINGKVANKFVISDWHHDVDVITDDTKTFQEAASAVLTKINELIASLDSDERLVIDDVDFRGIDSLMPIDARHFVPSDTPNVTAVGLSRITAGATQIVTYAVNISSSARFYWSRLTVADGTLAEGSYLGSDTLTSHNCSKVSLRYSIYKML